MPLINVQLFAVALFLAGNILGPAQMVIGADRAFVMVSILSTAVFFLAIAPLLYAFGAVGGVFAQVVFYLILLVGSWALLLHLTKDISGGASPPSFRMASISAAP